MISLYNMSQNCPDMTEEFVHHWEGGYKILIGCKARMNTTKTKETEKKNEDINCTFKSDWDMDIERKNISIF